MNEKRFTMDNPNDWGFPITDNDTGKVYSCASNQLMKDLCDEINKIVKENEQLKKEIDELKQQLKIKRVVNKQYIAHQEYKRKVAETLQQCYTFATDFKPSLIAGKTIHRELVTVTRPMLKGIAEELGVELE